MKKVLSVLLILAAIFGFYGGGVSLNDVLACKEYWEEEGEKTTADLNKLEDGLDELGENTEAYMDGLDQVAEGEADLAAGEADYAAGQKTLKAGVAKLAKVGAVVNSITNVENEAKTWLKAFNDLSTDGAMNELGKLYGQLSKYKDADGSGMLAKAAVAVGGVYTKVGEAKESKPEDFHGLVTVDARRSTLYQGYNLTQSIPEEMGGGTFLLSDIVAQLKNIDKMNSALKDVADAAKAYEEAMKDYNVQYKSVAPQAQTKLEKAVSTAASKALGNKDITSQMTAEQKTALGAFTKKACITGIENMETLNLTLNGIPKIQAGLLESLGTIKAGAQDAIKKNQPVVNKGKKDLADGAAKLAQGRADLADGKAQLAEYEDGEQQIRDGLATLMETEANGGLTSIEDRIGAGEDFSLEDGNLDFDAGYNGVDTGREYSADSSVLITKELTQRATGFGIGIGGGVLALVAAVLGFMKKNKGAAVVGLLAAVAAAAGAFVAKSAGLEFSAIAGSALGATPLLALGILAAVAVVHAIAYFAAPKAA